ncbi:sulfotransferase family 2 domain-containing protein [Vibrio owensii]
MQKLIKPLVSYYNLLKEQICYWHLSIRIKKNLNLFESCTVYSEGQIKNELRIKNRILFVHIPKSAGMSIVRSLYSTKESIHASVSDYYKVEPCFNENRFVFSVVRNPYDRLYSAYNYLQHGGMNTIDKVWYELYVKEYGTFEEFVINGGLKKAILEKADHFITQSDFIKINGDLYVDKIFKIEQLSELSEYFKDNFDINMDLSVINQSPKTSKYDKYLLSDEVINVINDVYSEDFEFLGYEKL